MNVLQRLIRNIKKKKQKQNEFSSFSFIFPRRVFFSYVHVIHYNDVFIHSYYFMENLRRRDDCD